MKVMRVNTLTNLRNEQSFSAILSISNLRRTNDIAIANTAINPNTAQRNTLNKGRIANVVPKSF